MLIRNVDDVIKHYLRYLDEHKYRYFDSLPVRTAVADQDCARVPDHLQWTEAPLPYAYGREWTSWWFHTTARIPDELAGQQVFLHVVPGIDSLVYVNRVPTAAANFYHRKVRLTAAAQAGEIFEVHIESYAGHKMPSGGDDDFATFLGTDRLLVHYASGSGHGCWQAGHPLMFSEARLAVRNEPFYELYYDAFVLYNLACQLDGDSLRKNRILSGLYRALMTVHFSAGREAQQAQARAALACLKPLLACRNGDSTPTLYCIGHAHLDMLWLWPYSEAKRKMARTFSNMALMGEEFPDFVFLQSQPAQLEQMALDYPDVFAKVKRAYEGGRWEPNGCSWVEMDSNIPGGEALIRQFVVGHQTTRTLLGYQGDTLWVPDCFGHSAALPQILRGCEVRFFCTGRIGGWDTQYRTDFPYDVFHWKGIDGTPVDAHLPRGGYLGSTLPECLIGSWKKMRHKEVVDGMICNAGYGDGGGGATRQDLEVMKRMADLEGCPKAKWSSMSVGLKTMFDGAEDIPVWEGDLDVPYFQGTFTTNGELKKLNRRLEYQFRDVEFLSVLTMPGVWDALCSRVHASLPAAAMAYPVDELRRCWKTLLTSHFHDAITGASFRKVNEELAVSQAELAAALGRLGEARRDMLSRVLDTSAGTRPYVCSNGLSWARRSQVAIAVDHDAPQGASPRALTAKGHARCLGQRTWTLDGVRREVFSVSAPSMGASVYYLEDAGAALPPSPFRYTGNTLSTPYYEIRFDACGRIASLVDRVSGKDYVRTGAALNTLQMAEDATLICDAWNIDSAQSLKTETLNPEVTSTVISDGHAFFQLRCEFPIGERSHWTQDLIVYADSRRIDFVTRVEWQETNRWLKTAFPVNVSSSRVKCEIQYGHIERDTHENREHDRGRFEFCAHKWIALGDGSHGMALLNDCKYGHDVRDSVMRLTLLRAPKSPDAQIDMGRHEFTYSLLPYDSGTGIHEIVRAAYDLNVPISLTATTAHPGGSDTFSVFQIDNPNVVLEVVKKSEDDDQVVARLYEVSGGEQTANLTAAVDFAAVNETNMLERAEVELPFERHGVKLHFRAFEIKTLKFRLAAG